MCIQENCTLQKIPNGLYRNFCDFLILGVFKLEELKSSQSMTQVDLPFLVQLSKQLYELNFKLHIL